MTSTSWTPPETRDTSASAGTARGVPALALGACIMSESRCGIIQLPKITDPRGNLTFVEGNRHVPFDIQRVYYLYDVPGGAERGGHAHKALRQLLIAMSGSFDVIVDDGRGRAQF